MAREASEIATDASLEPLYVKGDLARLVQSFGNVMTNAAKYTQAGGKIGISVTEEKAESLTVEISDNGAGISPEFLPRIFDLFSQADQNARSFARRSRNRLVGGQEAGGDARRAGLGAQRGTGPWLDLPDHAAARRAAAGRTLDYRHRRVPSRRILIVDDNADAANSLSELLKLDGHETRPAFSAEEALSLADDFNPEIVLLDIGLPRMDGYEVARRLRLSPLRKHTTLIALTGYGQQEDLDRAQAAGFDAHLVKPVDLVALTKLLSQ